MPTPSSIGGTLLLADFGTTKFGTDSTSVAKITSRLSVEQSEQLALRLQRSPGHDGDEHWRDKGFASKVYGDNTSLLGNTGKLRP